MASNNFLYYLSEPSVGIQAGHFNRMSGVHKFGHNGDVGSSFETIWGEGGIYAYPSVAITMQVSSSDVDDDDGDTGARSVEIEGLDGDYNEISEIVTMNGQSQVATANTYLRVHRMKVLTAGSSGQNEGIIYIGTGSPTNGKPSTVYGLIEANENQTLMAMYTVPAGHRAYVLQGRFTSNISKAVTVKICAREEGSVFQVKIYRSFINGQIGLTHRTSEFYPPKTDIEARAKTAAGGGDISADFELALERITGG